MLLKHGLIVKMHFENLLQRKVMWCYILGGQIMENKDLKMMALSDDDLDGVVGGMDLRNMMEIQCTCGTVNMVDISKSSYICKKCKKINHIDGWLVVNTCNTGLEGIAVRMDRDTFLLSRMSQVNATACRDTIKNAESCKKMVDITADF